MTKRKRLLIGAALLGLGTCIGVGTQLEPIANHYVKPIVEEKIHSAINGSVTYDSMSVNWLGQVTVHNITVKDDKERLVGHVDTANVGLQIGKGLYELLRGGSGAAFVGTVDLHHPDFHIWQNQDGSWNVMHLLKEQRTEEPSSFSGAIAIDDGTVVIRLQDGTVYKISQLDGAVSASGNPIWDGAFTANVNDHKVSARGHFNIDNPKEFEAHVQAPTLPIAWAKPFVGGDITLLGGQINDVRWQVKGHDGNYTMHGNLTVANGHVGYQAKGIALDIDGVRGKVYADSNRIVLPGLTATVNGEQVEADGVLALADDMGLNLNGRVKNVNIHAILPDIGGTVTGNVHIGGSASHWRIDGDVEAQDITYDGYTLNKVNAQFTGNAEEWRIPSITLQVGDGQFLGSGSYNVKTTEFGGQIQGGGADLGVLTAKLDTPISGTVDGGLIVGGKDGTLTGISGELYAHNVNYQGITVDSARLSLTGNGESITIDQGNVQMGAGVATVYGTIGKSSVNVQFSGNDIPVSALANYINKPIGGALTTYGQVTGSLDNPMVHASVNVTNPTYEKSQFHALQGTLDYGDGIAKLSDWRLTSLGGGFTVNGTVGTRPGQTMDLQVDADQERLETIVHPFFMAPVTGWISSRNRITGTLDNPQVTGRLHWWDGSAFGALVTDVHASYQVKGTDFYLDDIQATLYDGAFTGYAAMVNGQLSGHVDGDEIDLRRWGRLANLPLTGDATVSGDLSGTVDKPVFTGQLNVPSGTINGVPLRELETQLYVDPNVVNLEGLSLRGKAGGHLRAQLGMTLDPTRRLFGKITMEKGSIGSVGQMIAGEAVPYDGLLDGHVAIGGTAFNPTVQVQGTINDVSYNQHLLGTATVDLGLDDHTVSIRTLKLPIGKGLIAVAGTADLQGDSNIQLAVNDVDVSPFIPNGTPLTGTLQAVVNVTGKTKNPKVELSGQIDNGSYNGVTIDQASILATMENKIIHINQIIGGKGAYKLTASGDVPLAAFYTSGYLPPGDDKGMNVSIDFNQADLAVLPLSTPMFTRGEGPLKGKLTITGSYDAPQVHGTVSIENGILGIKHVAKPLTNINGSLIFNGNSGDLQANMMMGKGDAGLMGHVVWAGKSLTDYRGGVQLNGLELDSEYFKGPLVGEFYINDQNGMSTLSGHLDLANNIIKIPLSFESTGGGTPLALNLNIHAGSNVHLYDKLLYSMFVEGDVQFNGTVDHPMSAGNFTVTKGNFNYLSHSFRINKGVAHFVNDSFLPNLDLQATNMTSNYRIKLGVKGSVDRLDMTLTADPHLSERQIISLLTFGRGTESNSSALTSADADALIASGLQMLAFGYVQDAVQNTLGLDMMNITTGSLDPNDATDASSQGNYNIEIGKYVIPNLMVTYGQGLNNSVQKYGIQYALGSQWRFTTWHTSTGRTFSGARWHTEF